jgi:hypothetical protein
VRDQGHHLAFAAGEPFHSYRGHRAGRAGEFGCAAAEGQQGLVSTERAGVRVS